MLGRTGRGVPLRPSPDSTPVLAPPGRRLRVTIPRRNGEAGALSRRALLLFPSVLSASGQRHAPHPLLVQGSKLGMLRTLLQIVAMTGLPIHALPGGALPQLPLVHRPVSLMRLCLPSVVRLSPVRVSLRTFCVALSRWRALQWSRGACPVTLPCMSRRTRLMQLRWSNRLSAV